jgi:DNA-binding transcriptional MerR regulator
VAVLLGVKAHVLRYWETEFPQLRPQKSRSNQRLYRRREVELLLEIRGLLYERGFTIVGARKALEEARAGGLGVPSLAPLPTSVPPVLSGPPTEPEPLLAAALSVPPAVSAGPAPEQLALALASSDRAMLEELRHEVQDLLDLCKEG